MEPVYAGVNLVGRAAIAALGLRVAVNGAEHLPTSGPAIVVMPHSSFVDFPLAELAARRRRRYLRFLCRHDVWEPPRARRLIAGAMDAMGHVPVDRAAPAYAYLRARRHLEAGEVIGVFPEAGISTSFTVRALMPGAAALAAETGAPIVPLVTWGTQRISRVGAPPETTRGRPVDVVLGAPRRLAPDADPREETVRLGHELQAMLEEVQRRLRHRPRPGEWAPWYPAHLGGHAPTPAEARQVERVPRSAVPAVWAPGARVSGAGRASAPRPAPPPRAAAEPRDRARGSSLPTPGR